MSGEGGRIDRDELLARIDLEHLLDSLVGPADRSHRWHCPDRTHPDLHPSVTVRIGGDGVQRWRCWSGGHGGTAIDAVTAAHSMRTGDAIRWLADHHANLPVLLRPAPPSLPPVGRPSPELAAYVERAATLLWTPAGRPQREWLAERGLRAEVLHANRVGADPGRHYLPRPKGLPGGWPAVVYPSMSPTGELTYLQARYLHPPEHRSKYDNPSASLAANPRLAWTTPIGQQREGVLIVCEGTADALTAAQAGIRAVGVLGAAYPDRRVADGIVHGRQQVRELSSSAVVVCFDNDPAGRTGAARLIELLAERDLAATTVLPPDGLDLTAWAAADPHWTATLTANSTPPPQMSAPAVTARDLSVPHRSISLGGIR